MAISVTRNRVVHTGRVGGRDHYRVELEYEDAESSGADSAILIEGLPKRWTVLSVRAAVTAGATGTTYNPELCESSATATSVKTRIYRHAAAVVADSTEVGDAPGAFAYTPDGKATYFPNHDSGTDNDGYAYLDIVSGVGS